MCRCVAARQGVNGRVEHHLRFLLILLGVLGGVVSRAAEPDNTRWPALTASARAQSASDPNVLADLEAQFPAQCDWLLQDSGSAIGAWLSSRPAVEEEDRILSAVLDELGESAATLRQQAAELRQVGRAAGDQRWFELYERACRRRRAQRLKIVFDQSPRIIFTKHATLGGSHYAYTEAQSDAQSERNFAPGSALCLLEFVEGEPQVRTLLESADGVIRDPDVSWDGRRVLFSWKKSDREDDYHLYELEIGTSQLRQITSGLGYADYEGIYLPNGDLLFNSTRCVQTVDCWWTEVSNLYTSGPNGELMRRLTFDQVHDNFPTVMPDGRILYTRWEYNDRGQIFVQGLFQMNPDGTGQTEFYGNNSWFPTALLHARGIPGTQKAVAIFSGHHTLQVGKLGILDVAKGRQENSGAHLIAPIRSTPAEHTDAYGQDGELFQYPYPLSETAFLAACAPQGWSRQPTLFQLFLVLSDGRRELLTADAAQSCSQPVPLRPRVRPQPRPTRVDYRQTNGVIYMQDLYASPGWAAIPTGSVHRLRVIALDYRAAGVGRNYNTGPAGEALVSTPVAIGNGSWDVKSVLGDATVYSDGSACFQVPARVPIYFQAIDDHGYAVQTMRSWTTLQPGEHLSCVGCHEPKHQTPPAQAGLSLAFQLGPQPLKEFYGPPRGFSFLREIQPILDRHCIRCHKDSGLLSQRIERSARRGSRETGALESGTDPGHVENAFSLRAVPVIEKVAKRRWTEGYLALTHAHWGNLENTRYLAGESNELVNWIGAQSVPPLLPPYTAGAARSRLLTMLRDGHYGVALSGEELDKVACWIDLLVPFCGDYTEANTWTEEEMEFYQRYLRKRHIMAATERENIQAYLRSQAEVTAGE